MVLNGGRLWESIEGGTCTRVNMYARKSNEKVVKDDVNWETFVEIRDV